MSVYRLRDMMGAGVVCRVDAYLEEEDRVQKAYEAQATRARRQETLEALNKNAEEMRRRQAKMRERKRSAQMEFSSDSNEEEEVEEDQVAVEEPLERTPVRKKSKETPSYWKSLTFRRRLSCASVVTAFSPSKSVTSQDSLIVDKNDEAHDEFKTIARNAAEEDEKVVREAFERYDTDESGYLELTELRAVLCDLGLMPQTEEEKAGLRRTFVHVGLGTEDGHTDSEAEDDDSERRTFRERVARLGGEKGVAHSITVSAQELPALLARIRKRLKTCRDKAYGELFSQYDIFERGELDFGTIKTILQQEGLEPRNPEEQAAFKELSRLLRQRHRTAREFIHQATVNLKRSKARQKSYDIKDRLRAAVRRRSSSNTPKYQNDEEQKPGNSRRTSMMVAPYGAAEQPARRASQRPQLPTIKARTRREMQSESAGTFNFSDFQFLMEFIREMRERSIAEEQRTLAESLGLLTQDAKDNTGVSSKLFLEFRGELKRCYDMFEIFDEDGSGYLELNEIWEALMSLGLMPKRHRDKVSILHLINDATQRTLLTQFRRSTLTLMSERNSLQTEKRPSIIPKIPSPSVASKKIAKPGSEGVNMVLMFLYTQEEQDDIEEDEDSGEDQKGWLRSQLMQNQRIDFKDFLGLLSQIRAWQNQRMREELKPLFQKSLRRQTTQGAVLPIPEVCKILEELKMGPENLEEQEKIKELLEHSNEWGFKPPCLDFEAFVQFIRQMREWASGVKRERENVYAKKLFDYDERKVTMYRMTFDILDTAGVDSLGITQVRRVFAFLHRAINSDQLRQLFSRIDLDGSGTIGFLEFLHLVHELDVSAGTGKWGHEVVSPPPSPAKETRRTNDRSTLRPKLTVSFNNEDDTSSSDLSETETRSEDPDGSQGAEDLERRTSTQASSELCAARLDD
jgi:Ca2+-binding EF-hand superfamily protein